MRRITSFLIFLVCLGLIATAPVSAGLFSSDTLVTIDGNKYTTDDFKRWWQYWKVEGEALPPSPVPYVNWLLLAREGERMLLNDTPEFKRQTRIFLQSRGLMMLQYEEVNSKVKVTDDDIKKRYEENYLPRWLVQRLVFKDEDATLTAWQELSAGSLTPDNLIERTPEQGGPEKTNENWLRPDQIDPGWSAIFQKLKVGQVVDPAEHNKGRVLYMLKEQKGYDEEDFAKYRDNIKKDLAREQAKALTRELLARLRTKYQVNIDEERITALDINADLDTFSDAPVITSSRQNISEKEFMTVIKRLMSRRTQAAHAAFNEEEAKNLKNESVENIIAQSVTNWEALDRHYEEKEPFKWAYDFNFRHRMVLALEQRLFNSETDVTDVEIKAYYDENIDRYTQAARVKLYIIDDTQGPIDQIWADVAVGKNFQEVVKKQFGVHIEPKEAPVNHLDPEVRDMVVKLAEGETSQIFKAQDIRVMVHLVERTPEAPLPFESVKKSIRSAILKERQTTLRNNYLEKLKSNSEIKIEERQWQKIKKELGEEA